IQEADLRCRGDLWDACRAGDLDRVRFVVAQYCNKVERRQRNEPKPPPWYTLRHLHRYSLLHEACDQQHLDMVCYLVTELRVPRHLQDASGCTALHVAAMRGFVAGCAVLLETECDSDEDVETLCLGVDTRGRTPLHWSLLSGSSSCGKAAVAKYLVHKCMAALHVSDFDGITPLHLAIWRGDVALVHELIACGANVNATTQSVVGTLWAAIPAASVL
uniref:Uncharacterized protein n=1 Tax=Globisporangium ultimum (strain ATCC 200006 / CBS 805.95 / DAOM BR144) TaxID=431595 RepID=K3WIT4_GLOUD